MLKLMVVFKTVPLQEFGAFLNTVDKCWRKQSSSPLGKGQSLYTLSGKYNDNEDLINEDLC